MNLKAVSLRLLLVTILFSFVASCLHEPNPTCEGVDVKISLIKTDADPDKSNGTIVVVADGPAKFFTYSINGTTFQASDRFIGLDSGSYTVIAQNSWGCKGTLVTKINKVYVDPCVGVSFTTAVTNATLGQSNGSVTGTLTGGTGYTYNLNGGAFQASSTFSGLAAGNYTMTAKNNNSCIFTSQAMVGETNLCAGVTVVVTAITTDPTLGQSDGKITASAIGGSGFTYSINSGAFQSSGLFANLTAGNYAITAKSADGCTGSTQVVLNGINPCAGVTVAVSAATVNPSLNQSDGSIIATATGGTGFTYTINGGAYQSSGTFTGLAAGNFTIGAKNSNGCMGTTQVALGSTNPCAGVTVTVTGTVTDTSVGLSNGSIVASAGSSGYTYSLNNGAYQTSGTFSGLAAGNYSVIAKSSMGCLGSTSFTVASINPCAGVTVTVTGSVTSATTGQSNGSITASATGGTGFTFSLNNGAYQTSGTFSGLAAGNYTVGAKNASGCIGSSSFTVASTNPCANITILITATTTLSNNCVTPGTGSITALASGSTGFTYNLNNGAYQSSGTFSALSPASYTIGAKDMNGCTSTSSVTVGTVAAGLTFSAVKVLMQTRCSGNGCHTNGQSQKGYNFDTDCKIVNAWSGINGSCITGTLKKMPISPQANLTAAEKKAITDWIAAGHGFGN